MSSESSGEPVGALLCAAPDGMGTLEEGLLWSILAGRPVLAWSLEALVNLPRIIQIGFLVTSGREREAEELVEALPGRPRQEIRISSPASASAAGGLVMDALEALSPACRLVVIHQGNCPLVTTGSIALAVAAVDEHPRSGVVAAAPVGETIKRTVGQIVIETPQRDRLLSLGTPCVFPREALLQAYGTYLSRGDGKMVSRVGPIQMALAWGMRVLPVASNADGENIPINRWDDLLLAEALLEARQ
jgi:2-C-methyl-D-erythritol 4-phosphate cytidylyltransferase